ncbi:lytic transglycosylase domain-containing protein [Pontibacter cellulosilyticus]|uniref:LysM peptidoglycan-binding domain-containing protein n=1 Tax=Pontibacter cellulosilyticus TaxID=1720253 RepID=A0A923N8N1_9BACT|nr:lytic transglycosylase domain-containing protein [Pontibacter cellulosilyticus]MBC5993807.1 LysM peptidoglycan-binding domain-containing protein [Pontibacter cellulosilyticus]
MTQFRLFTVLATIIGSLCATGAQAANYGFIQEQLVLEDTLKPVKDTTFLSEEDLALLVEYIPNEPNEVIQDRLSCIESDMPLVFNNFVRAHIDYFTIRNRKYTRKMLTRENVYFPLFEKYLEKHNMPRDLKYLSIVESGLNPKAASWAGAVGLWQFIKVTGKEYGLEQNQYIDERMDPEKSTDAALRFLKRLYRTYGDWELAMAAYNCGPGNVNKAIRKAGGGKRTFWEIFPHLPRETRSYVPNMTAVIYAMNYAAEHNIFSDSILYTPDVAYLELNKEVDLEKLAEELHLTKEQLMALNPELKTTKIPQHLLNYRIKIPAQSAKLVASANDKDCILLAAAPVKHPEPETAPEPAKSKALLASNTEEKPDKDETKPTDKITYVVRRGDNLSNIAKDYNITVEDLKEWNDIKGSSIMPGQKLLVMKPADEANTTLLAVNKEAAAPAKATPAKSAIEKIKKESLIYHVQPGDTLWTISQKHNGLTVEQIKRLNKLKSNAIQPGQKLILG